MSDLRERLIELSKDMPRGWQASLARACQVTGPSVAGWLSGKTKALEGENLLRAALFFKVRPEWLATGKGRQYPHPKHPEAPPDSPLELSVERERRSRAKMPSSDRELILALRKRLTPLDDDLRASIVSKISSMSKRIDDEDHANTMAELIERELHSAGIHQESLSGNEN